MGDLFFHALGFMKRPGNVGGSYYDISLAYAREIKERHSGLKNDE